jgi:hypothetical protein
MDKDRNADGSWRLIYAATARIPNGSWRWRLIYGFPWENMHLRLYEGPSYQDALAAAQNYLRKWRHRRRTVDILSTTTRNYTWRPIAVLRHTIEVSLEPDIHSTPQIHAPDYGRRPEVHAPEGEEWLWCNGCDKRLVARDDELT